MTSIPTSTLRDAIAALKNELREAKYKVDIALAEAADVCESRGGHRHWHPYKSRTAWLEAKGNS